MNFRLVVVIRLGFIAALDKDISADGWIIGAIGPRQLRLLLELLLEVLESFVKATFTKEFGLSVLADAAPTRPSIVFSIVGEQLAQVSGVRRIGQTNAHLDTIEFVIILPGVGLVERRVVYYAVFVVNEHAERGR